MTCALVNRIIDASVVDGRGNRTAVFLQGCNYRCCYCHNPETQSICNTCGDCIAGCPKGALAIKNGQMIYDAKACCGCDRCIAICKHHSSPKAVWMTAEDCAARIAQNIPFIRGVTLSGGECTLYPDFVRELFEQTARKGLSNLIDSNGSYAFFEDDSILQNCEGVMLDVKAWDAEIYKRLTGAERPPILRNLAFLYEQGKLVEIRIVVEPTSVDAQQIVEAMGNAIPLPGREKVLLRLIPYRAFGVDKQWRKELRTPNQAAMDRLLAVCRGLGWGNCQSA